MRSTTLAGILKVWVAALAFAAAAAIGGDAFAARQGPPAGPTGPSGPSSGHVQPSYSDPTSSCANGLWLAPPPAFGDAADSVKEMSEATQGYLRNCSCATQACIADALDQYAQALEQIAPRLPPHLQNVAGVVATAAGRARVARTKAEAVRALHDAIAAVHKDIELVKAEDPDDPRATRGGDFVAATLNVASLTLEKGGGL